MSTPSAERLTPLEPKEEFTIGQNGHETITNGGQQHMNPLLATNPAAEAAMAAVAGLRTQGGQPDQTSASGGAEAGDDDDDSDDEGLPALERQATHGPPLDRRPSSVGRPGRRPGTGDRAAGRDREGDRGPWTGPLAGTEADRGPYAVAVRRTDLAGRCQKSQIS